MGTITVYLDLEIEQRLRQLALDTNQSMSFYARELITKGLEDIEDYYRASRLSERIRSGEEKVYSMAEVEASLSLTRGN